MNRWTFILILIVIVGSLALIGYLVDQGYLQNFQWQTLTMFFAALAGPYKLFSNWWRERGMDMKIREKHVEIKEQEKKHRVETDIELQTREKRIKLMDEELKLIDERIKIIEEKRSQIRPEVESMSDDELAEQGKNLFG